MTPPVAAPGPVRKLLRFARLPDRALATLRRVLEDDAEFRARVAAIAIEEELGRASWLWLVRPAGWEEELDGLEQEAVNSASSAREERHERGARRRLVAAEEARRRAEAALVVANASATRAADDLAAERLARRAAEVQSTSLADQVSELNARVVALEVEVREAEQLVASLEDAGTKFEGERLRWQGRMEELEREVSVLREPPPEAGPIAPASDTSAVAVAVAQAAAAARQLGSALAAASEALGGVPATNEQATLVGLRTETVSGPGTGSPGVATGDTGVRPERAGRRGSPGRQPVSLPPAVFEDSAMAAEYLLRIPGMVLLVDGYNVTLEAWPGKPIPEQRRRLVDALAGLAARTGSEIQVVFDGAEQVEHRATGLPPRSAVRVRFSPPDVEADDVLIDLCEVLPIGRPVTVATSDRRVQEEVRKRGGNVISTPQLLGVLGSR